MTNTELQLAGVELYFDHLEKAKSFYRDTLGLAISDEEQNHYCQFDGGGTFLCLETKGTESYPSRDKAVVFFNVPDVRSQVEKIGRERFVGFGPEDSEGRISWAVLHDPEGHNVMMLQTKK